MEFLYQSLQSRLHLWRLHRELHERRWKTTEICNGGSSAIRSTGRNHPNTSSNWEILVLLKKIWRCFRYWQSVILKGKHLRQNIKLSWAESFQIRMVWLVDKKFPVQKVLQEKTCRCGWRKLIFEWFRTSTKQYQMVWNEWWYYRMILTLWSYIFDFFFHGLTVCWIRVGTSEKTRFIPIHTLGRKLGHRTYSAVMKAHILTGCDVTSKIWTKTAAIKANPESYLHNFGEQNNSSAAKSFDELRYLWYDTLMTSFRSHKSVISMLKFILEKCWGPKIARNKMKKIWNQQKDKN